MKLSGADIIVRTLIEQGVEEGWELAKDVVDDVEITSSDKTEGKKQ